MTGLTSKVENQDRVEKTVRRRRLFENVTHLGVEMMSQKRLEGLFKTETIDALWLKQRPHNNEGDVVARACESPRHAPPIFFSYRDKQSQRESRGSQPQHRPPVGSRALGSSSAEHGESRSQFLTHTPTTYTEACSRFRCTVRRNGTENGQNLGLFRLVLMLKTACPICGANKAT